MTGCTITFSPFLKEATASPTSCTTPAFSWPKVYGRVTCTFSRQTPSTICKSVWHTPAPVTRTKTSLGFLIRGASTSTTLRGLSYEKTRAAFAPGGVVWFNGYTPGTIVITAGDTITWHLTGGLHTVTSTGTLSNGSFAYDSSPAFTPAGALADMGPGKLLAPGSVFELDTGTLATGTYRYFCKIHPGMAGNLTGTTALSP